MISLRRSRWLVALLFCGGLFVCTSPVQALPEKQIRKLVDQAEDYEKQANWEAAREIYEVLLGQNDPGLQIRERYHHALRRCWQVRRHEDTSYRKEVLSVEYGQSLKLYKTISKALLEGSVDKKKLSPTQLFQKGLEELDAALTNPLFLQQHVPAGKQHGIPAFRAALKKTWGDSANLTREKAVEQINQVAMKAVTELNLDATVVTMEFACGACYAIDEYTAYLTPNQLRELTQNLLRSEAIGVGLVLTVRDNKIVVSDIAMDSPAYESPERFIIDDQIISVNKKPVVDLPLLTVKEMLEGPVGSMVDIEVLRPGETSFRLIRLPRVRAAVPSVIYFVWPNTPYGFLKINGFTETTVQDVEKALADLSKEGMKGLILDLRDNNGGVFESAIDTARKFLATGIITSRRHQDPNSNFVYHAKNPDALRLPMTLLVDGGTASAAELLAGALKDNDRAYVIGQTTFGKGCTQCVLKLPKATGNVPTGGMKLTVARFYSPKGAAYSGRGITPHFVIDDPMPQSQSAMMGGPYLDKAIQELNRMTMPR